MAFKAAIFDIGGVLLKSPIHYLKQFATKNGLPEKFLVNVLRKDAPDNAFCDAEKGKISVSQLVEALREDFQREAQVNSIELPSSFSVEEMVRGLHRQRANKEMIDAVINLKNHGFRTGVLTNNFLYDLPTVAGDYADSNVLVSMRFLFDEVMESCRLGMRKPDTEIYSLACQRMGFAPQEIIFVDDLQGNLRNAAKVGIETVWFQDAQSTLARIQELTGVDVFKTPVPVSAEPDRLSHSYITTKDGTRLHYVDVGEGPVVILCHGFPESWYSWRKQIPALVLAGYRVIVPDQRGYGDSTAPPDVKDYTLDRIASDLAEIMDTLSIIKATFVGHDWGGSVVWRMALKHPERTRGVVGVNTAYFPPNPKSNPLEKMYKHPRMFDYQLYFQNPGVAEAELERDLEKAIKYFFRAPRKEDYFPGLEKLSFANVRARGGILAGVPDDISRPSLLTERDVAYYVKQYKTSGFRGPLNWYRNIEENWRDSLQYVGRKIFAPSLMVTAEKDRVLTPESSKFMEPWVPNLSRLHIKDCGHWTQMERPRELNEGIIKWLDDVHRKTEGSVTSKL